MEAKLHVRRLNQFLLYATEECYPFIDGLTRIVPGQGQVILIMPPFGLEQRTIELGKLIILCSTKYRI